MTKESILAKVSEMLYNSYDPRLYEGTHSTPSLIEFTDTPHPSIINGVRYTVIIYLPLITYHARHGAHMV